MVNYPQRHINILNFSFIFGFVAFFLNIFSERMINVPVGEFLLFGLILLHILYAPTFLRLPSCNIAFILSIFIIFWCSTVAYYHSGSSLDFIRTFLRLFLFYETIILYILLKNKKSVLYFAIGMLVAYMLNFVIGAAYTFIFDFGNVRKLKYIIPTPAILLLFLLLHRKNISKTILVLTVSSLAIMIVTMPFIGTRGAFLSLIISMLFFLGTRIRRLPNGMFIFGALFLPLIPVILIALQYNTYNIISITDWLFVSGRASLSNVERVLMLYASLDVLLNNPLLGIGTENFVFQFEEAYMFLTSQASAAGNSPHNYYMEVAVPYGIPPLILTMFMWGIFYKYFFSSIKNLGSSRGIAAAACGTIGWIMLFRPISGIGRIEVLALVLIMLYGVSGPKRSQQKKCV